MIGNEAGAWVALAIIAILTIPQLIVGVIIYTDMFKGKFSNDKKD